MIRIIDTAQNASAAASCLREAGIEVVVRYYSEFTRLPGKRLGAQEAAALGEAGLRLCAVYQDAQTEPRHFSHSRGLARGSYAYRYAQDVIRQPPGSAIYFAVDFDADDGDVDDAVAPFFQGVASAFERESGGRPDYRIGVYGSGLVCRRLLDDGIAAFAWLARSRGWRETERFDASGAWVLKQTDETELCGLGVDFNETNPANAPFGAFIPEVAEPVRGQRFRVTARSGLRLRAGPSTDFDIVTVMPLGTTVFVLAREAAWAQVDLQGDGRADGFAHASFLEPIA